MTPAGTLVAPGALASVNKILNAKYDIFLEMIDIQKRWRRKIEEASSYWSACTFQDIFLYYYPNIVWMKEGELGMGNQLQELISNY